MESEQIKSEVRKKYGAVARQSTSCCGPTVEEGAKIQSQKLGYSNDELTQIPEGANLGLGCGNPTAVASLQEGEIVLDLGSGAGFDAFLAANAVGESGKVIGVDMTPDMIHKATENAKKGQYKNVEFRHGEIESLPVEDNSVDVIISNCVINLAPDKDRVFEEAYRVLRSGGRLMVSDIVITKPLPAQIQKSIAAWTGCIAGASLKEEYLDGIRKAGFQNVEIKSSTNAGSLLNSSCCDPSTNDQSSCCGSTTNDPLSDAAESVQSINVSATK